MHLSDRSSSLAPARPFGRAVGPVRRGSVAAVAAVLAIVALTGCAGSGTGSAGAESGAAGEAGSTISVVASTDVWGDIASQVGGDLVTVTSIIDDPSKDPHEYQADAQDQLALSKAAVIIENGGGYDDFIDTMRSSANNDDATVLNAAEISGYDQNPSDGSFNEHLWYDLPTVGKVVDRISQSLSALDPAGAATFTANASAYLSTLDALEVTEASLKSSFAGQGVAITEPVPLYLLDAVGLVNKTPAEFSEAIENGTDVAPDVLAETTALFGDGEVKVLAYNSQTSGSQTEAVMAAAESAGVGVVPVAETLPSGENYAQWMADTLSALQGALSK